MSTGDWFEAAIRLFVAVSMGAGAVRGFRRARQQGFAASVPTAITTVLLVLYIVGGVLLVAGYFIFKAPDYAVLFGIVAIVYFAGGFFAIAKVGGYMESRLKRSIRWPG